MNSILSNQPIYIYGDGSQKRCFTYIDEVADSIYKCGFQHVNKMIFNIGSDEISTVNNLFEVIKSVTGTSTKPTYINERPLDIYEVVADHSLSKRTFSDYRAKALKEGIEETWLYAKSLGKKQQRFTDVEIYSDKLPQNWKN